MLEPAESGGPMIGDIGGGGDRSMLVVADPQGAWTTTLSPGHYTVTASTPGMLPASRDDVALVAGAKRTGIDLVLEAGGATVHGTISDIFGGPIAAAHVTVHEDGFAAMKGKGGTVGAVSGADGTYQLTLRDGEWRAKVTHLDYATATRSFELAGHPLELSFKLTPASTIRGQVISRADGKPVGGAAVSGSSRHGGGGDGATAVTDAQGNFTLHGVRWGTVELTATARGYASAAPAAVELGVGEQVDGVKVFVDRAYTISGFVVKKGASAEGIAGVHVGVFSIASKESAVATAASGEDGYFEILGVRPASYMAFAVGGDVIPDVGKPIAVTNADVGNVLVVMDAGVTLSGRVEPAAVATLSLELESDKIGFGNMFDVVKAAMVSAASDATGAFVVRNVPPGEFTLVARLGDGRIGKLAVTIGTTDQSGLVVPLEARAAIAGTVVDGNGAPVGDVRVKARPEKSTSGISMQMNDNAGGLTAADGTFRIGGLSPGKVTLSVNDDQGPLAWADKTHDAKHPYELEVSGTAETTVSLTVEPRDGIIRGVVLDVDGKPAADAWVTATYGVRAAAEPSGEVSITIGDSGGDASDEVPGMDSAPPVLAGADGRFVVDHLRRGAYTVVADAAKGTSRAHKTGVATGTTVTLQLETLGSLAGAVTTGTTPVTDYMLECSGPMPQSRHVIAANGSYAFDRLAPGEYQCTATAAVGPASGTAVVATGPTQLNLVIGNWATIAGTVVDAKTAAPLAGLKVAVMGGTGAGIEELLNGGGPTTDASGHFEVGKQSAGSGSLMIYDGGMSGMKPIAQQKYTLTTGQHLDLGIIKGVPPK